MKTRVTFNPEDFRGHGQLIIRDSFPVGCTDYNLGVTVAYKIGFLAGRDAEGKHIMVSLADGMALTYASLDLLCETLNSDEYGFRPMSRHEIERIVGGHGSRFPE